MPQTNAAYWRAKIARNVARDRRVKKELKALGWRAVTVWECEIKAADRLVRRLTKFLGP